MGQYYLREDDFRFMAAIILIEINNFLLIFAAELQKFAGILISLGQNFDNFFPRTFFSIVECRCYDVLELQT